MASIGFLVVGSAWLANPLAAQSQISVGRNVQVSKADALTIHDEVLMAADPVDPNRLLACSIVDPSNGGHKTVGYASMDGGSSWSPVISHAGSAGDPTCAFGLDGHAYFASLLAKKPKGDESLVIFPKASYSTDGGKTWQDSKLPGGDKLDVDRDYIISDTVSDKYRGRVYLYMQMHGQGLDGGHIPMGITLWHSVDNGVTFSPPIQTFPPTDKTVFWLAGSAVLSAGTFVALAGQIDVPGDVGQRREKEIGFKMGELKVVTSSDGGETFDPAVKINDMYDHWNDADIARLAVDNSSGVFKDRLYAVWSDGRTGGRKHILLSYSADKGKTWSPPRRIDDDDRLPYGGLFRNAGMPAVAVSKNGVVGVSWYDRRDNATNDVDYWPRFAASFDGGESFTPSVRVSEQPRVFGKNEEWMANSINGVDSVIPPKPNPFLVEFKVMRNEWEWGGHTAGLAVTADGIFHPLWIDNRTGIHQMWTTPVKANGTAVENGSAELANMKDVSGQCLIQITDLSYDRQQNILTAKVQVKNVSKESIAAPLKLRVTELSSPLGKVQVVNADNKITTVGAVWDFSSAVPSGELAGDSSTQPIELRFKFVDLNPNPFLQERKLQRDWISFSGHVLAHSK